MFPVWESNLTIVNTDTGFSFQFRLIMKTMEFNQFLKQTIVYLVELEFHQARRQDVINRSGMKLSFATGREQNNLLHTMFPNTVFIW